MTDAGTVYGRHDLHLLPADDRAATASRLGLPYLEQFASSVDAVQRAAEGGTVRRYLRDLVRQGWFAIVSPTTGRRLQSGCSLLLVDKTVVFSFPDEPALLLGVGDLSLGYPICAALLTDRALLLGLVATDWGFSERHLPGLASVIDATQWTPGPATTGLQLVLGDLNFAHHAWNQLSALDELVPQGVPDGLTMVATQEPLGPIQDLFPDLAKWPLTYTHDTELQALNAPGALFAPVGGRKISAGLTERLTAVADANGTAAGQAIVATVAGARGPVLWMSVRTQNRTLTNQHAVLTALGAAFLQSAPDGIIVIDGYSLTADLARYPRYHQDMAHKIAAEDRVAAEAVRDALAAAGSAGRVEIAVGLTILDSIALARHASIYFCHHGTVQHKIGWFHSVPGLVHSNRTILAHTPGAWVAAQSAVALPPAYVSPQLVSDDEVPAGVHAYGHLLRYENYTIIDIPATIAAFFAHAANNGVVLTAAAAGSAGS